MMWVIGNWKMNGSRESVAGLLERLTTAWAVNRGSGEVTVVVTPPAVFLEQAQRALVGSGIVLGGQTLAPAWTGAMTGELSGAMLADFGCTHVLVGHSERRERFGETPESAASRALAAVRAGLRPVVCVGERAGERDAGETHAVLEAQLEPVLGLLGDEDLAQLLIAYEPVWAIGSGRSATPEEAQAVHAWLRKRLAQRSATLARAMPILYGGSVRADNARGLLEQVDIDGALVGGASLDASEFAEIARVAGDVSRSRAQANTQGQA